MRVLFIVHQFFPEFSSGTEQVTLALAKAVQRAGHRADVLTCSLDSRAGWAGTTPEGFRRTGVHGLEVVGIPVDMLPDGELGFVGIIGPHQRQAPARRARLERAADAFLVRGSYDVVHVVHTMRMVDVINRVQAAGLPYILTLTDFFLSCYRINLVRKNGALCAGSEGGGACFKHCPDAGHNLLLVEQRQAAMAAVLRGAALRVACSPFVADAFRREHPDVPISVIGHGIDLLRMRPRDARLVDQVVFGYVGTLSHAKGVDVLARAFAMTQAASARLDLVGPPGDDPDVVEELRWLAGRDPRIRLLGALPATDIPAALAGLDVLCLPTRLPETFSLALHEGFAAGLPALVADMGHPALVVREARCGRVLPDGDEAAWTSAITEIAANPALLDGWREHLPLPARVEEETFLYGQLYKACFT